MKHIIYEFNPTTEEASYADGQSDCSLMKIVLDQLIGLPMFQ